MSLIRIEDDGHGMDRADLILSVERHATSKLSVDDLDDIRTLGFRGEALASIGSVAELSIASRTAEADSGLRLEVRSGMRTGPVPQAMNRGTIVEVRNLFARVPARLKFLKTDRAEAAAITDVVKRLAMANPAVHFVLNGTDRSPSNWPAVTGPGALQARLAQVIGDDFASQCGNAGDQPPWRGGGGAGRPADLYPGQFAQPVLLRQRPVGPRQGAGGRRTRRLCRLHLPRPLSRRGTLYRHRSCRGGCECASSQGGAALPRCGGGAGRCHPRHRGGADGSRVQGVDQRRRGCAGGVHDAAIRNCCTRLPRAGPGSSLGAGKHPAAPASSWAPQSLDGFTEPSARVEAEPPPALVEYPLGTARAQMFDNFIIAQNGEGLLLIDQHAAHERLVYERFKAQLASGPVPSQAQLIPLVIELPEEDCVRLEEAAPELERFGLYLERFGPRAIAVRETPALLGNSDIDGLVRDVADGLAEWDSIAAVSDRMEAIIARMACTARSAPAAACGSTK